MDGSFTPPPQPRRPLVPHGAEWALAPLPLLFALIALVLGPADARDIAADWLYLLVFHGFLPAFALLAGCRALWRPEAEDRLDWRPGAALVICAAGALAGQFLLEQRGILAGTQIPALSCILGLSLPLWATCLLASRGGRGWAALAWAGGTVIAGIAIAFGAAVVLHLDTLAVHNGMVAGGAVWTVLALALTRWTPPWRRPGVALLLTGGIVAGAPAAAVVTWLGTPPAETTIPFHVHEPVLYEQPVLIEGYSRRSGIPRMFELWLEDGTVTPLPRRVDHACSLPALGRVVRVQGLGQRMRIGLTPPRAAVYADGRLSRLPGRTSGDMGLLRCSSEGQAMWSAGTTMRVWEPSSGRDWVVETDGEAIAFPCFTTHQPGVLYRLRGDASPPYPRRYLPLEDGATPLAGEEADTMRCNEAWDGDQDLWFERPIPHSQVPWRVHDRVAGTVDEIAERIERVRYWQGDLAFVMLRAAGGGYRMTVWRAGMGRIADWPCPGANRIYPMSGGREVLLVTDSGPENGPPWSLYRATDGVLRRQGTSSRVWPVSSTDLLELRDGALVLHDLDGDGGEVQILPKE
jgi:hypothetical protein